jgi:hypothetical protein
MHEVLFHVFLILFIVQFFICIALRFELLLIVLLGLFLAALRRGIHDSQICVVVNFAQKLLNPRIDEIVAHQCRNKRPLIGLFFEHQIEQELDIFIRVFGHRVGLLVFNLIKDDGQLLVLEGPPQHNELVQGAAQGPNVGLDAVGVSLNDLWRHEIGRAEESVCILDIFEFLPLKTDDYLGNSEIAQFHDIFGQKNILRFYIPMQNVLLMHVVEGQDHLAYPGQNLLVVEGLALRLLVLDFVVERAALRVLHDDVEVVLLDEGLVEVDDGGPLQHLQENDLDLRVFFVLSAHVVQRDYFQSEQLAVGAPLHQLDRA